MSRFLFKLVGSFCCLLFLLSFFFTGCSHAPQKNIAETDLAISSDALLHDEVPLSITIDFRTYNGMYTGELQNNIPHGKGTFVASDDKTSEKLFSYTGDFAEGKFCGDGQITYPDGSILTGSFKENSANGKCSVLHPDKTRHTVSYSEGHPYGLVRNYSENDEFLSFDWYYKEELVSDIKQLAIQAQYSELYHSETTLKDSVLKLSCIVERIIETKDSCTLILKDHEKNLYLASYKNTAFSRYEQAILPALKPQDSIIIYGFYTGINSISYTDSDEKAVSISYSYPCLEPFYAELSDGSPFQLADTDLTYMEIAENPYMVSQHGITLKGKILSVLKTKRKYYIKFCEIEGNKSLSDHIYITSINRKNTPPAPGDFLTIKGTLNGNYKLWLTERSFAEYGSSDYELYPLIKPTRVSITPSQQ